MASNEITVSVPSFVSIPRAAFEEGLVIVSSPDLDEAETDALKNHMLDELGGRVDRPSLVVVNFDAEVIVLDETQMRKMGWVRAEETGK